MNNRSLALARVAGPVAFISAWALAALVTGMDYSSIDDAISRLAVDALHGVFATAGYVTLVAVPLLAFVPLGQRHPRLIKAGLVASMMATGRLSGAVLADGR